MSTFTLYHGGSRWNGRPEVRPAKEGRYEGGTGLYFTTSWLTARSHAKGGKVITVAQIDSDFTPINEIEIKRGDIAAFLDATRMKFKPRIMSDIDDHIKRRGRGDTVPANIFNNLVVNHRSGSGAAGVEVAKFIASHGGDAEIQRQSNEDWLLVMNPDIIKSHRVLLPNEKIEFELPRIEKPVASLAGRGSEVPIVGRGATFAPSL